MSEFKECEDLECDQKFKNHAWGAIKADGWLKLKDGRVYCPSHIPAWYGEWKKKQQWKKERGLSGRSTFKGT